MHSIWFYLLKYVSENRKLAALHYTENLEFSQIKKLIENLHVPPSRRAFIIPNWAKISEKFIEICAGLGGPTNLGVRFIRQLLAILELGKLSNRTIVIYN